MDSVESLFTLKDGIDCRLNEFERRLAGFEGKLEVLEGMSSEFERRLDDVELTLSRRTSAAPHADVPTELERRGLHRRARSASTPRQVETVVREAQDWAFRARSARSRSCSEEGRGYR